MFDQCLVKRERMQGQDVKSQGHVVGFSVSLSYPRNTFDLTSVELACAGGVGLYLDGAAGGQVSINDNDLRNNAKGSVHVAPVSRVCGKPEEAAVKEAAVGV